MTNVLRLQNQDGNTIKQGDKSVIRYELIDYNSTLENLEDKVAKIYLSNGINVVYKTETNVIKENNKYFVEFNINDLLIVNTYYLEIVVDDKFIFPSDDTERLQVTSSIIGNEFSKVIEKNLFKELIQYGINNSLFNGLTVGGNSEVTPLTINGYEYDSEGNTKVNFSDNNSITVLKGKDGVDGSNGLDGKDGLNGADGVDGKDFTFDMFTPEQIESLKGEQGKQGVKGLDGKDGKDGLQGPKGEKGDKGERGIAGKDGNETSFLIVEDVDDVTAFIPISSDEYNAMRYLRDKTITDEFMKGYSNYIAKEGLKEKVSTVKEDYNKVLSGSLIVTEGNDNPYTTVIGTTIEYKFTGTSISMTANCNSVGGIWKATIDGQFIKNISTYGDKVTTFLISDSLESKEHVLLLEFIGQDPAHPTQTPRGWIRTGKYNSTYSSFTVINKTKETGMVNVADVAFPNSNKEYAISVMDSDKTKQAEFFPYHGTQTSFKGENYVKQLIVDGNIISLNEPSDKIWFTEATLIQKVEHKLSSDSSIRMEATFIVTFKDNKIYNDIRFKWIQPSIVTSGYVFQMPFDTNFLDTVIVGDIEQVSKSLDYGTNTDFKNKDAKIYRGVSSLPISKDFVYQFTVTENSVPMYRLWLQHRDERLQKLYPQYYNQSQKQSGDIDIFRGYYEIKKIQDANRIYKL